MVGQLKDNGATETIAFTQIRPTKWTTIRQLRQELAALFGLDETKTQLWSYSSGSM
jgi:hypothetical protein